MISGVGSLQSVLQIDTSTVGKTRQGSHMPPPPPPGGEAFEASPMGQIMSLRESLNSEDRSALDDFMKGLFEQMNSDSFDAASTAEEAPEALKEFAAENGIDLEQLFTEMKQHHDDMKVRFEAEGYDARGMRPPFPGPDLASIIGSNSSSEA
jgi:hypothetical protein